MINKKLIILSIFFVSLLSISVVSAADNASDAVNIEEVTDNVVSINENVFDNDTIEDSEQDLQVIGKNDEVGTLSELYALIQTTPSGGTLNLTKNYQYDSSNYHMTIDKPIIIDGTGHEIDGKNNDFYFEFQSNNITLKNITFKNSLHNEYMYAILSFEGENCLIENCNFIDIKNTYTYSPSDVISFSDKHNEINNCKFINNSANLIKSFYEMDSIENCSFINNSCKNMMYFYDGFGKISNCYFANNQKRLMYAGYGLNTIDNCSFLNNSPSDLYLVYMESGKICNSKFEDLSEISDLSCIELYNVTFNNNQIESIAYTKLADNESLKIVFFDDNSNPLKNKNVVILFNNEHFIYSTQDNGFLRFNRTLNIGNNQIVIINPYTDESIKLNLTGKKHNIECSDLIVNYTGDDNYTIRIVDDNGLPIAYADVTLKSNGENYPLVTNSEGYASFHLNFDGVSIQGYNEEVHTSVLKSFGAVGTNEFDIIYNDDIVSKIVIINPLDSEVSIFDSKTNLGESVLLTAVIYTEHDLIYGNPGIVRFYDGENFIGESHVSQDIATLNYTPITGGLHNITAIFTSKYYVVSNDSAILSVPKEEVNLIIDNIGTIYLSNSTDLSVNVSSNSKKVNDGTIKYYINDQLIGESNVTDGVSYYHYTANCTGLLNLTVIYGETANYLASNASITFYVDKMPNGDINENSKEDSKSDSVNSKTLPKQVTKITLTLKNIKVKRSAKKLILQATLKQGNKALSGKKITFKFNGKKYTAKTNKKGVAKVTIKKKILKKLKVGKKVKYQASYGKITVKKSVKVKK